MSVHISQAIASRVALQVCLSETISLGSVLIVKRRRGPCDQECGLPNRNLRFELPIPRNSSLTRLEPPPQYRVEPQVSTSKKTPLQIGDRDFGHAHGHVPDTIIPGRTMQSLQRSRVLDIDAFALSCQFIVQANGGNWLLRSVLAWCLERLIMT